MEAETRVRVLRRAQRLAARLPPPWDRRARETGKVLLDYRGARSSGRRGARFRRLARHCPLLVTPFGQGQLVVDVRDQEISRTVFMTGGYERLYMRTALDYLRGERSTSVAGTTFLDVGANIGTSTVDALLHFGFGRAVCFEPDADNVRLLRMNLALNGLEDRVEVRPLALSDVDGTAVLARSARNFGDHRLAPEPGVSLAPAGHRVDRARLDTLVADGAVRLDEVGLLWMDVQGHEPFALAGASTAVAAGVPVMLEYSPASLVAAGALEALEARVRDNYTTVVDVHLLAHGCHRDAVLRAADVDRLAARYHDVDHTDLLLLR